MGSFILNFDGDLIGHNNEVIVYNASFEKTGVARVITREKTITQVIIHMKSHL